MPAIVGAISINIVSGVMNVGDVGIISPSTYSKTYAGGSSFNSGNTLNITNAPSVVNVYGSFAYEERAIGTPDPEPG
ncbi:spore germination protein [Paenibacillus sp. TAB 01]|uniref:spore germination protein n=1 Tax=Paenibacillus sp. TAB 01 TaxID=3368988 RepID=UPI003751001E